MFGYECWEMFTWILSERFRQKAKWKMLKFGF